MSNDGHDYHTPHGLGSPLTSAQINGPLFTLDTQLRSLARVRANIREFEAAPGVGVDNAAAINAAIASLPLGGGVVEVPPGDWYFGSSLHVGGVTRAFGTIRLVGMGGLAGSGLAASRLIMTNLAEPGLDCTAANVWLEHINLVGPTAGVGDVGSIGIKSNYDVHLVGSEVVGFYTCLQTFGAVSGVSGSWYSGILSSWFRDPYYACIRSAGNNLTVENTHTYHGLYGVLAQQGSSIRLISGAHEHHGNVGVFLSGVNSADVEGNYFENGGVGVANLWLGGNSPDYAPKVEGNFFSPASETGFSQVRLGGIRGGILKGNWYGSTPGGHAILFAAGSDSSVVKGLEIGESYLADGPSSIGDPVAGSSGIVIHTGGIRAALPGANQTLVAGTAIDVNSETVCVYTASAITSTAAPTIADGVSGQLVRIMNAGGNNLTLQDQGTLAGSNLRLVAATVTLTPRDSIVLQWLNPVGAGLGNWVQVGNLVTVV